MLENINWKQWVNEKAGEQAEVAYENYNKIKSFEDVGYLLVSYVVSGGEVIKNVTRNDTIEVADIVVSLQNSIMARDGVSFQTAIANTVYYLDFEKSGDWSWGTVHPAGTVGTDYLTVATVTTDSNRNILTITDTRGPVGGMRLKDEFGLEDYAKKEVVDAQLADTAEDINGLTVNKADKTEVNALATSKANQTALDATNNTVSLKADKSYVDTQIGTIGNASPKGTYATLTALQTAFPTGTTGIYVVGADGKWYYWNGSAWIAGGTYQATGIAAGSIVSSQLSDGFNNRGNVDGLTGGDFNTVLSSGVRLFLNNPLNSPSGLGAPSGILSVERVNDRWILQRVSHLTDVTKTFWRVIDTSVSYFQAWQQANIGAINVSSSMLAPSIITGDKLATHFDFKSTISNADLGTIKDAGSYLLTGTLVNGPKGYSGNSRLFVNVVGADKRWIMQNLMALDTPKAHYVRTLDNTNIVADKAWTTMYMTDDRPNVDGSLGGDINLTTESGSYLFLNTPLNLPNGFGSASGTLEVHTVNKRWTYQRLMGLNDTSNQYERAIDLQGMTEGTPVYYDWKKIYRGDGALGLLGKKVVNFGDSIFGNYEGSTSISGYLGALSGATTYNVGFGGCRMSTHIAGWDAFSMYRLVDAIISRDFSLQDAAVAAPPSGMPAYFSSHLAALKGIDFTTVDYITIAYGTNDYTAGKEIGLGEDLNTFSGALRYSLRRLFESYPNLKVLVLSPTYRFWSNADQSFKEDSDTVKYNAQNDTLDAFVAAVKNVSKEFKTPYVDNYYELGINKQNRLKYFSWNDGTHPQALGREKIAHKLSSTLISKF